MNDKRILAFCLMDPPFESARTTTAFRLLHAAIDRGHDVKVFAYEGAVALPFRHQAAHANAVHGRDLEQEAHPLPRVWIQELFDLAASRGTTVDWINCGLCVDERGVGEAIGGVRRGSPADFWRASTEAHATLVIGTR